MSSQEFHEHHLSGSVLPPEFAEDLIKCFPEDGGLSYEDIRVQQESLYLAFQKKGKSQNGETSRSNSFLGSTRSSSGVDIESQLALDEALARSLQLDDGFDDVYDPAVESPPPRAPPPPPPPRRHPPPPPPPPRVVGRSVIAGNMIHEVENLSATDGINVDNMSYEELQTLGDAIGHENRGLSDDMISRLPTFRYNNGFFFWKKKSDNDCVICQSEYANREKLVSLLCAHTFHFKCIKPWLKEQKTCPVCKEEVRET